MFDSDVDHAMHQVEAILEAALEAATRVPVQGEPNHDREAMLRRIESFDYDSDRVSDDLEQDIRALVDISRASVPDTATAAIERIREAVSGHPECDRYSEGDVISCGWKSAYASVLAALAGKEKNDE